MIGAVFTLLGSALSIWQSKEKRKYLDRYLSLKRDYYEAINRPPEEWNDARIDGLKFELQLLVDSLSSQIGNGADASNKSDI